MKVFIVTMGEYSDCSLEGAFSTREKAEVYIAKFLRADGFYTYSPDIQEFDLDALDGCPVTWSATMDANGSVHIHAHKGDRVKPPEMYNGQPRGTGHTEAEAIAAMRSLQNPSE